MKTSWFFPVYFVSWAKRIGIQALLIFTVGYAASYQFAAAQNTAAQRTIAEGNQAYDRNQFDEAITAYRKALDFSELKREVRFEVTERLADAYRLSNRFEEAEKWYKLLLRRQRKNPTAVLNYGKALKNSAKFDEAKDQFRDYLKLKPESEKGKMLLRSCDSAQKWLFNPIDVDVREVVSINTEAREFSPTVYQDGLMFTSDREGTTRKFIRLDGGQQVNRLDLFYATYSPKENSYSNASVIPGLNYPGHDASPTLSLDEDEIYFTRTVATKAKATAQRATYTPQRKRDRASENQQAGRGEKVVINNLQIFYSYKKKDSSWSKPSNDLVMNNTNYSVGHPTLSPDGKTLVYMSDMKGGEGGTDLYYSQRKGDSTWTPPRNLGETVNTFGFELFPFFDRQGNLYYSTDGKAGLGRLDMFKTRFDSARLTWEEPQNMRPPINSIFDDFGIAKVPGATVERGYFSSQRLNGTGNDDVYTYIYNDISLILDGRQLLLEDLGFFNGFSYQLFAKENRTEIPGRKQKQYITYDLIDEQEYLLAIRKDGFYFDEITFQYNGKANGRLTRLKIDPGRQPLLFTGLYKRYRLTANDSGDVAYNKDSFQVLAGAPVGLLQEDKLLERDTTDREGTFNFRLDTSGTYVISTDSLDVNQDIFEPEPEKQDQEDVVSYRNDTTIINASDSFRYLYGAISSRGATPTRVQRGRVRISQGGRKIGTGSISDTAAYLVQLPLKAATAPLTYMVSAYGFQDTSFRYEWQDESSLSQRNDFQLTPKKAITISGKVLPRENPRETSLDLFVDGELQTKTRPDAQGNYSLDAFADQAYEVVVNKKGYLSEEAEVEAAQKDVEDLDFTLSEKATVNRVVELDNIYWDLDSYQVKEDAEPTLNKLVRFMDANPEKTIEIRSHTDKRGSSSYNRYLSQRRAQAVVNYLKEKGVKSRRLVPAGYGERDPIIANAQTDEEFQRNRRTEFKIIDLDGFVNVARNRFRKRVEKGSDEGTYYTVQIGVFSRPLPEDHPYFRGLGDLAVQLVDGYYRYYYGFTTEQPEARQFLQQVRYRGLKESFIAVFEGGKRVEIL